MTGQRTNRLIANNPTGNGQVVVNGEVVPTDLDGYCAFRNAREVRRGLWTIITRNNRRELAWEPEVATDEWLRERNIIPKIGQAA